jgi:hypothetical protein
MTLAPELLDRIDVYWRVANYLSVGTGKPRPGQNFIYVVGQRPILDRGVVK